MPDSITVQTGDDPCLSCKGYMKCDYRHLGPIGGCEGFLDGGKHKHSDGRRMFRREDYVARLTSVNGPRALSRLLGILPLSAQDLE